MKTYQSIKLALFSIGFILCCGTAHALPEGAPEWSATQNFTRPANAEPGAPFAGRLALETTAMETHTTPDEKFIKNPWAWWGIFDFLAAQDPKEAVPLFKLDAGLFPGLELGFVTSPDGDLVPTDRRLIRRSIENRTESFWELITGPGKTWKITDGARKGWSKAAFPISLVQSQEGESWLGLGSFYYRDEEVSSLRIEFGPVSAGGFIFWDPDFDVVAWGEIPAQYAGLVKDADKIRAAWLQEEAEELPIRPLSDLEAPGLDTALAHDNLLTLAILKDGALYMKSVDTPFGEHPFPRGMRVGVWSISKSLIPGMSALRLAQKFGTEFLDQPLVSFFKEGEEFKYADAASRERWQNVTIRHALHMETGMGPTGYDTNWAMENTATYEWSYSYKTADQIRLYFAQTPNPDVKGPGEKFVYIDQDMWAATVAMDRFLKSKEGANASIVKMLSEEVYAPIGNPHFALGTSYTATGEPGMPYAAWGALPTITSLANAGKLITNGGKSPDGSQILHEGLTRAMFDNDAYSLAFWKQTPMIGGSKLVVPEMSGSGGNHVLMLKNGTVAVVLSRDSYNVAWSDEELAGVIKAALGSKPK